MRHFIKAYIDAEERRVYDILQRLSPECWRVLLHLVEGDPRPMVSCS